jgi:hypothetical protein
MYLQLVSIGVGAAYGFTAWVIQDVPALAKGDQHTITPAQLRIVMALPLVVTLIVTIPSFVAPTVVIAGILTYLVTLITMRIRSRNNKDPDPREPH